MLRNILVPLDGSELGELALGYAISLASTLEISLNIVTVNEGRDKEHERAYGIYLDKIVERLRNTLHKDVDYPNITAAIITGRAADALVRYATKQGTDLIIMVSHGRSGIMPWSTGSTAQRVVQKSKTPILLIRAGDTKQPLIQNPFPRILLPLDGSKIGESAIPLVKDLALAFHSEVEILRVVELVEHVHTIGGIDHFMFNDEQVKRMEDEVGGYLEEKAHEFRDARIENRKILRTGDPAIEIIRVSEVEEVDLVAMSSHGKTGITKWVLGSVSSKILQAGKKPLLLVRPLYKNVT